MDLCGSLWISVDLGGSLWISVDLGGSRWSPHLNALQPEFPGLQMEMEVDPPGSNIKSLVLSD